jgi:hypothetical protein
MANEKTLNDLSLKLQETNLRLEILADSGNKQETHLATLVKASKGDKLQDAEDKREANKRDRSGIAHGETPNDAAKSAEGSSKGGSLLTRSALLTGIIGLISAAFAGLVGIFSVAGLASLGFGLLKGGLLLGLVGTIAAFAVRTVTNYFGVTDIWDKAVDEFMNGKVTPGSMGVAIGGTLGAAAGFAIAGLPGAIVGGMIGSALGAVLVSFAQDKFKLSDEEMLKLMKVVGVGMSVGALAGAAAGMIFGPIGIMGGMLLGAAIGGIIAYLGMKAVDYFSSDKFDQLMQDAKDAVSDFFTGAFDAFISIITGNGAMGRGSLSERMGTEDRETWMKMVDPETGMTNQKKHEGNVMGAFQDYTLKGGDSSVKAPDVVAAEAAKDAEMKRLQITPMSPPQMFNLMKQYDMAGGMGRMNTQVDASNSSISQSQQVLIRPHAMEEASYGGILAR